MEREILFEEQEVPGFVMSEYGMYGQGFVPAPFSLTVGEEYIVLWDDAEYTVTAIDIGAFFPGGVAAGNGNGFGLPGNNEPFIVAAFETNVTLFVVDPTDTRDTHSFGIYKEIKEEKPANLILRDPDGTEQEYPMRQMLEVDTTDGNTALYSKGEIVENVPIALDFTAGDQIITAPDGKLVKSAVIAMPEDCKPENILKDKNIGGVLGTLESGGGETGGDTPYQFSICKVATNYNAGSASYASVTVTSTITLPPKSRVVDVSWCAVQARTYSGYVGTGLAGISVAETDTEKTVTVTSTTNSVYKNWGVAVPVLVRFEIPGVYKRINENETSTVYADETVDVLPSYARFEWDVKEVDLSQSKIKNLPNYCIYTSRVEIVRFPATLESLQNYSCSSNNASYEITVDFSKHTFVPTLASTLVFGNYKIKEIRVPASLYSEWISTTNWSAIADYIVAV